MQESNAWQKSLCLRTSIDCACSCVLYMRYRSTRVVIFVVVLKAGTYMYTYLVGGQGGRGLTQVLAVTPLPLFFLEVDRKKGGRNSGAVRYI